MRVRRTFVERVKITGPMKERERAMEYLRFHGFHFVYSGPKMTGPGTCDVTKFVLKGEKTQRDKGGEGLSLF